MRQRATVICDCAEVATVNPCDARFTRRKMFGFINPWAGALAYFHAATAP